MLIEKNILIQLANSDTKEFLFRWQLVHDEANKKLQLLDSAINDIQNWERRLLELQDWIIYMDKYLSTRIDQDIFADDVPDDFVVSFLITLKKSESKKLIFIYIYYSEFKKNSFKMKYY